MINEYKGIFYGNNEEKDYYEGGAHFSYRELIQKLLKLQREPKLKMEHHNKNNLRRKLYTKYKKLFLEGRIWLIGNTNSKSKRIILKEESNIEETNEDINSIHKKIKSFNKHKTHQIKRNENQNKSYLQNIVLNEQILLKLNWKYIVTNKRNNKENYLDLNLFNKGSNISKILLIIIIRKIHI